MYSFEAILCSEMLEHVPEHTHALDEFARLLKPGGVAILTAQALQNEPRPIWMMEVSTNEHQPLGTSMNPNFEKTFEVFFDSGYRAFTADTDAKILEKSDVDDVVANRKRLTTHNFVFR